MRIAALSVLVACGGVLATAQAATQLDSLGFTYSGTVTKYADLNALALGNSSGTSTIAASAAQDLRIRFNEGIGGTTDQLLIGTAWDPVVTSTGQTSPSAQSLIGFIQLDARGAMGSVGSMNAGWNAALTDFTLKITGSNLSNSNGTGTTTRLWNPAGSTGDAGKFLSYDLSLTASGMGTAAWDAVSGTYQAYGNPSTVNGYLSGVFENTSSSDAGIYTFNLNLGYGSWVLAQNGDITIADSYEDTFLAQGSVFRSAIPEPSTYALCLGLGTLGVAALWRRRQRS